MMPLLMFTAAISTWLVQTIVGVVGAPMIALGLISPGQGLGKADPALLLIVNLFLRPSLNILGLVAGAKLFNIGFLFFTNAFVSTVNDIFYVMNVDSTSLMSIASIMFLFAYTFMISALCSRCYALIYLLPDRVLTWIGAPAIPSQEVQAILQSSRRNLQQAAQTGMEAGKKLMEGITEQFESMSEKAMDDKKEGKGISYYQSGTIIYNGFWKNNIVCDLITLEIEILVKQNKNIGIISKKIIDILKDAEYNVSDAYPIYIYFSKKYKLIQLNGYSFKKNY
jgi:hypothetical protein